MRVAMKKVILFTVMFGCVVFYGVGEVSAQECKALVEQKCGVCHFANYVCDGLDKKKGSWRWKRTVKSMVDQGMEASKDEISQLVTCLSTSRDQVVPICNEKKK